MRVVGLLLLLLSAELLSAEIAIVGKSGVGVDFRDQIGESVGLFHGDRRMKKSVGVDFPILFNRVFGIQPGIEFAAFSKRYDGGIYQGKFNFETVEYEPLKPLDRAKTSSYFLGFPLYFRFDIPAAMVKPYLGVGASFSFSKWDKSWLRSSEGKESFAVSYEKTEDSLFVPVKKATEVRVSPLSQIAGISIPAGTGCIIVEERFDLFLDLSLHIGYRFQLSR